MSAGPQHRREQVPAERRSGRLLPVVLAALAQAAAARAGVTFHTGVVEVSLRLRAQDPSGRPVTDLRPDEIEVLEDGEPQKVSGLAYERAGLSVVLVVDSSESMTFRMDDAIGAARSFVGMVRDEDDVAVLDFDSRVKVVAGFGQARGSVREALKVMTADGGTLLYDAMAEATELLAGRPGTRAMVVLSDGEDGSLDGGSRHRFAEVKELARRHEAEVHCVGVGLAINRFELEDIAEATGGTATVVADSGTLHRIYEKLPRELAEGYTLTYASGHTARDGAFRRVEVRVKRPGVEVRAKPGYYAPGPVALPRGEPERGSPRASTR